MADTGVDFHGVTSALKMVSPVHIKWCHNNTFTCLLHIYVQRLNGSQMQTVYNIVKCKFQYKFTVTVTEWWLL